MITPLNVSPVRWVVLAGSVVLLAVVLIVRQRGLPSALRPYPDRTVLEAEQVRLAPFGNDVVQALRAELARLRQRAMSPDESVPGNWQVESVPPETGGGNLTRYVSLAPPPAWADVISLVARLEDRAGIVSLDIRSGGTTRKRGISRIEIVVPGTPGTTRRPAGATFPGAGGPDLPRTIGPVRHSALPSAGTVRAALPVPAGGAAFVPCRPDPPGRAVVRPTPEPIHPFNFLIQ